MTEKRIARRDNTDIIAKRRTIKRDTRWKIHLKAALRKRGIKNAFGLWQKIGGSKQTAAELFNGSVTMIRLETFDRLEDSLGITPFEILSTREEEDD
ncbi:MAG: helix-turn-helix transcriptional regulator [Acidobacteriota bacterium]|nr:helix-turn-helix transcriptional regulator [Acidobacteriota bacterium]